MYAIEFQTTIKDGIIEIPEVYRGRLQQRVRVILLGEEMMTSAMEKRSIADVLAAAPGQRVFKTAESVNQYLHEERESWER
ncbi:MAG: hypothetical protein KJ063_25445 [Anaerolineae bacterium]|nr:hypothetical protein [Anaerolineae bacterium]